jgi:glutamine cyclotransferase
MLFACGDKYKFKLISPKKIRIDKSLQLKVEEKNNRPFDSIHYFLDGIKINNAVVISTHKLGKHAVKAVVYFQEKQKSLTNTIYFLASKQPKIYTYKIINKYPHDAGAFTQGLEYHNGFIYETTGQHGTSSLRKVVLKTGKVVQKIDLDKKYFGEGLTIFNDKAYFLTWQKNIGFVYNLNDFTLVKTFNYENSKEGWGLTHNKGSLIKSDGTERLWFLDPETLKETHFIEAYTNTRKAEEINELEFIKGKIYANVWQKNTILIINPINGTIEGIIDLKGLDKKVTKGDEDAVLNGIAYDAKTDRLFVTGKNWDKLFEIKIFVKP